MHLVHHHQPLKHKTASVYKLNYWWEELLIACFFFSCHLLFHHHDDLSRPLVGCSELEELWVSEGVHDGDLLADLRERRAWSTAYVTTPYGFSVLWELMLCCHSQYIYTHNTMQVWYALSTFSLSLALIHLMILAALLVPEVFSVTL